MQVMQSKMYRLSQLEQKVASMSEMFATNLTWQDEKTMLQEETISFILETMQNLTDMLVPSSSFVNSVIKSNGAANQPASLRSSKYVDQPRESKEIEDMPWAEPKENK